MALTAEELARLHADQQRVNRESMAKLATEIRLKVPERANGAAAAEAFDYPELHASDEAPEPTPVPKFLKWAELEGKTPPPRTWFIEGWLTGGATLFAGKGGIGKSLVAQTLATALATGQNYLGPIAEPLRVVQWACEDDRDELWRRQVAICEYLKLPITDLGNLYLEPRVGFDNSLVTTVYGAATLTPLLRTLREHVNDLVADILILDNIGQTFGANENARHDATLFVNALAGLVTDRPFATILLGHPARSEGSEFAGSAAWENAVRTRWYLGHTLPDQPQPEEGNEPDPAIRYLCRRKANYSQADYLKLLYDEGVFKPERPAGEMTQRYNAARTEEDAQQAILFAIRKARDVGSRVVRAHNSPASLVRWMRDLQLGVGLGRRDLERAITQLMAAGRIKEGIVGRDNQRHPVMGLVPADFESTK